MQVAFGILQATVGGVLAGQGSFTVTPRPISPNVSFVSPGSVTTLAGQTTARQINLRVNATAITSTPPQRHFSVSCFPPATLNELARIGHRSVHRATGKSKTFTCQRVSGINLKSWI